MTIFEYNQLNEAEQREAVWEHGVMVGDRVDGGHRIVLYQLYSFYVELYYHLRHNVLKRLKSFSSTEGLDAYVKHVNMPSID